MIYHNFFRKHSNPNSPSHLFFHTYSNQNLDSSIHQMKAPNHPIKHHYPRFSHPHKVRVSMCKTEKAIWGFWVLPQSKRDFRGKGGHRSHKPAEDGRWKWGWKLVDGREWETHQGEKMNKVCVWMGSNMPCEAHGSSAFLFLLFHLATISRSLLFFRKSRGSASPCEYGEKAKMF